MAKYERITSAVWGKTPFPKMIESGISPDEIKQGIIETLNLYFENRDILNALSVEFLVPTAINVWRIRSDPWLLTKFQECLKILRQAKTTNPRASLRAAADWIPNTIYSSARFWSNLHLERDKAVLELDDFLHECLNDLGGVIEGLSKTYFQILLHQLKIGLGEQATKETIEASDLGVIVTELIQKSPIPDLFMPPPWNIKLSQWRNIAYHHSAQIENNEILCFYGKPPNISSIRLSRGDLLKVLWTAYKIYGTVMQAYEIFFVDNGSEIEPFITPEIVGMDVAEETQLLSFASGLMTVGFEVTEYRKSPEEGIMSVRDLTEMDQNSRSAHASQFLFRLWLITHSKVVRVTYQSKDGTPRIRFSLGTEICERVRNGELNYLEIANLMDVEFLKREEAKVDVPPTN